MADKLIQVGSRLVKIDESTSEYSHPSALDILRAVDSGEVSPDFIMDEHGTSRIRVSRFPVRPILKLSGTDSKDIRARIVLDSPQGEFRIDQMDDQYIYQGTWYPVFLEELKPYFNALESAGVVQGIPITVRQLLELRTAAFRNELSLVDEANLSAEALASSLNVPDTPGLKATLYPYQDAGLSYLKHMASLGIGGLLGDEMGLGKTLQAIGLIVSEYNSDRGPALVVCPASLMENWNRELGKFSPQLRKLIHRGSSRTGVPAPLAESDVVVTSYETLLRDEVVFRQVRWNLCILDEAQNIKNSQAQRTVAVKNLDRRISLAVTGTPVENSLGDLWSICDFILPGYLGEEQIFRQDYDDELSDASRLAEVVKPLVLRRRIDLVAQDLPERLEIVQFIGMSSRISQDYENMRVSAVDLDGGQKLALLGKLRIVCSTVFEQTIGATLEVSMKSLRLLEILTEAFESKHKAVIFVSFQAPIDDLHTLLRMTWSDYYFGVIDGRTPVSKREAILDLFRESEVPGALILNPKAAGVGLNIEAANYVVHFTPEWNPATTAQASARVYRRTQTRPVSIYHLLYSQTIEEVIRERSEFKSSLAANATRDNYGESIDTETISRALALSPLTHA